jgi:Trypsin-like peptidase domain
MKTINILLISLFSSTVGAAVYGTDDRRDINQVQALRQIAKSVAIAVPNNFLERRRDGLWKVDDVSVLGGSSEVNACLDERFAKQPIIGNCTGFLVGKRHLLTAGHCVLPNGIVDNDSKNPFCDAFSWYLNFNLDLLGKTSEGKIPAQNIYRCKRVIRAENIDKGNDFAVMELDRDVPDEFVPIKVADYKPRISQKVFTIGHPSGLPAKYSGASGVLNNKSPIYFEVNLDTQGGNSGGPVFDERKTAIGILVSGHPVDYYMEPSGCYRVNKCDATGTICNEDSQFKGLQTSNYVQYLHPALPYLKK